MTPLRSSISRLAVYKTLSKIYLDNMLVLRQRVHIWWSSHKTNGKPPFHLHLPPFHYWLYPVWLCMWQINKNLEPWKGFVRWHRRSRDTANMVDIACSYCVHTTYIHTLIDIDVLVVSLIKCSTFSESAWFQKQLCSSKHPTPLP